MINKDVVEAVIDPRAFPLGVNTLYSFWVKGELLKQGIKLKSKNKINLGPVEIEDCLVAPYTIREDRETGLIYVWQEQNNA